MVRGHNTCKINVLVEFDKKNVLVELNINVLGVSFWIFVPQLPCSEEKQTLTCQLSIDDGD
jgi:hypothetical protein